MWGQDVGSASITPLARIIPTRVGTRAVSLYGRQSRRDHPHACGDKAEASVPALHTLGSSPRVWGQEHQRTDRSLGKRIIPTRVGTRRLMLMGNIGEWDHPHACGDKSTSVIKALKILGSSPRVWGQVCYACRYTIQFRIIPTRVGTSTAIVITMISYWDHPHACGDKIPTLTYIFLTVDHPHACGDKTKETKENSGFAKSTA